MDTTRSNHLEELKGSDFQIVEGTPDIQGWKIVDYNGEKVGKVRDMLFDKDARKVRYIISELEGDREVLIPIGKAQLDIYESEVTIQDLTVAKLKSLPSYTTNDLTAEDEHAIQNLFRRYAGEGIVAGGAYNWDTFYNNEAFDQNRFNQKSANMHTNDDLNRDQGEKISGPEKTGKVPASGVMSETYKEDVNPQDELGSSLNDPQDPEESSKSREEDIDSYPLDEVDESAKKREEEDNFNRDNQDINPSTREDEFLK